MGVKEFVDETIASKPVVVFSKTYCPFCVKVKKLLQDDLKIAGDKMAVVELETRPDCSEIQTYLKGLTGASSVPRVFIKGQVIGGCDETFAQHTSGELKKKLDEAL